ncbi:MAG: acyltransferase [Aeromicrobium sp.]
MSSTATRTTPDGSTSQKRQYPLGWLRAVAALTVVTFHAYQYNRTETWPLDGIAHRLLLGSDLFVDMFFVLSAFVLWLPVARSAIAGTTGRPGRVVLFRRLARLVPLYFSVVLVVWAITNPSLPGHWQDLLLHLTFTQVYSDQYIFWTNGPAWSLAVEFHYYLLIAAAIPLVHALTLRTRSRRARIAVVMALPAACALVGITYLAWRIHVTQTPLEHWSAWFNPLAKGADFALGMTLAVVVASGTTIGNAARRVLGVVSISALVALVLVRPLDGPVSNWWHPLFALAIAVGLASIVLNEGQPAWMSWRPLGWIGGLGYGIYLIHEPVQRYIGSLGLLPDRAPGVTFLATTVIVAVPTTLLAWLSSRTVEEAGRRTLGLIDDDSRPRDYYAHVR